MQEEEETLTKREEEMLTNCWRIWTHFLCQRLSLEVAEISATSVKARRKSEARSILASMEDEFLSAETSVLTLLSLFFSEI